VDIVTCLDGHQCVNGGRCVPSDDNDEFQPLASFACECPDSHRGDFCHELNTNAKSSKMLTPGATFAVVLGALGGLLGMVVVTLLIVSATKPRKTPRASTTAGVLDPDGTSTMKGAIDSTVEDSTDILSQEDEKVIV
jgi:hypothetical protein